MTDVNYYRMKAVNDQQISVKSQSNQKYRRTRNYCGSTFTAINRDHCVPKVKSGTFYGSISCKRVD